MGRREATTAVTMLLLVGILVLGMVVGYKSLFRPLPGSGGTPAASPSPSCVPQKLRKVTTADVQVSVFNAGDRAGLAGATEDQLAGRGFKRGDIGNAPSGTQVRFVQVWTTTKGDPAATLVARQFGPHTVVRTVKKPLGPGVVVVVGSDYRGMQKHASRSLVVRRDTTVCVPTAGTPSAAS